MHDIDATVPESAQLLVPKPPQCDRNPLRKRLLGLIHTSLRYPWLSPTYDTTPIADADETIRAYWSVAYARRMPVSLPPFKPTSAFDILAGALEHMPFSDFVKLAGPDGEIDLTYLAQFDTVDQKPLGGKIALRDGKIVRLITERYGSVDVGSNGKDWPVQRAAAVLCRSLFLHQFYAGHFFRLHYMGSMLASHLVQETRHNSRIRLLTMPFMYDAIALLTEQLPVTTDVNYGNVRTLFNLSAKGCLQFFQYSIREFSLEVEYAHALQLYPKQLGVLEAAVADFLGDEAKTPVLIAPDLRGGTLSTVQKLALFIYTSTVNHYKHGYLGKPILPYLNLVVDDNAQKIGVYALIYTLSVFYSATLEKSLLVDDFGYLMPPDRKTAFVAVQKALEAMVAATPGMKLEGVNTAINN